MPMRLQPEESHSKLPLYLQPATVLRVQTVVRGALRVALASSLAAAGCTDAVDLGGASQGTSGTQPTDAATPDSTRPTPAAGSGGGGRAAAPDAAAAAAGGGATTTADSATTDPRDETDAGAAGSDGAAGAAGSVAPDPEEFRPVCEDGVAQFLRELTPAEPFDYAAWRTLVSAGFDTGTPRDVQHVGTACANAQDAMSCQDALTATGEGLMLSDDCVQIGPCRQYVVTTRGDTVKRYATRAELLEFLGSLDSAQDVLLILHYDGYSADCERTVVVRTATGFRASVTQMTSSCVVTHDLVELDVTAAGSVTEVSRAQIPTTVSVCIGRRPEGLVTQLPQANTRLGAYFASMAELEAASVNAFETLADELRMHGAPLRLIDAAHEAGRDEVRHAHRIRELAQRYGATPNYPTVEWRPLRDLEALALDNAVEGCVRETFGAAVGCMQAATARDPEIARAMQEIAADETRHAALASELDAWLLPQLSEQARARVELARARAVRELATEIMCQPDASLQALAGLPDCQQASVLHAMLERDLWQTSSAV